MNHMKNVARFGLLSVASAALFACAPHFGDDPDLQPSTGMHAVRINLLPTVGYYESAVNAINGRHYALALDYLQAARAAKADDVRVLTAFGVVYDKLGRFDLSARYYAQAAALDPKSTIIAQDVDYSHRLQVIAEGPAALAGNIGTAADVPKTASDAMIADTKPLEAPWNLAANATSLNTAAWQPVMVNARNMPALPDLTGNIATAVNIPKIAAETVVAEQTPSQAPSVQAVNATPLNITAWQPATVTARDMPVLSDLRGNIATAVNIPKIAPETVVAEQTPSHAPSVQAVNATPLSAEAWQPAMVTARDLPALPGLKVNIATAVNIPKTAPETVVAEQTPSQAPSVQAVNATPLNIAAWRPATVTARDMPVLPDLRGNIATAVNIPKPAPETVAAEQTLSQAPSAQAANAAPLNAAAWQSAVIATRDMSIPLNLTRNIASTINIPTMASEAGDALVNTSHAVPVLTISAVPVIAGSRPSRSVPVVQRPMPAVPPLDARFVAALTKPQLSSKIFFAYAKSVQVPRPQALTRARTVILVGHPLVLVNASGKRDTPMSVGRRLSGLGWSVAKSVEASPKVQTRTTIVYQKSKGAVAMALARTLSLFPRLVASENSIGLRLVLGSDLSGSVFKRYQQQMAGKRTRLADARYQPRE